MCFLAGCPLLLHGYVATRTPPPPTPPPTPRSPICDSPNASRRFALGASYVCLVGESLTSLVSALGMRESIRSSYDYGHVRHEHTPSLPPPLLLPTRLLPESHCPHRTHADDNVELFFSAFSGLLSLHPPSPIGPLMVPVYWPEKLSPLGEHARPPPTFSPSRWTLPLRHVIAVVVVVVVVAFATRERAA